MMDQKAIGKLYGRDYLQHSSFATTARRLCLNDRRVWFGGSILSWYSLPHEYFDTRDSGSIFVHLFIDFLTWSQEE